MRRFVKRSALAVTAAVTVLVMTAAPSIAATSYWYGQQNTSSPTLYQTNLLYHTTDFAYPPSTPAAATITTVEYSWRMMFGVPSNTTLNVYLCWGSTDNYCALLSAGTASSGSGGTPAFAGLSARTNFHYTLALTASKTYVLPPPYYPSSFYWMQVDYTY